MRNRIFVRERTDQPGWQMMYRRHFRHGNGIVRATAIWRGDIATRSHRIDPAARQAFPGDTPGPGIELDLEKTTRHPFAQEAPQRAFHRDGSAGDR
jgi:hypothetical protein